MDNEELRIEDINKKDSNIDGETCMTQTCIA
jgi:hypothetical protein